LRSYSTPMYGLHFLSLVYRDYVKKQTVNAYYRSVCILLTLAFLFGSFLSYGQSRCATVEYTKALQQKFPKLQQNQAFEAWFKKRTLQQQTNKLQRKQGEPYQIPVVVHVIHNGELIGNGTNISDEQILSQINVLNKDFKRLNSDAANTPADFLPVAGSLDIEFVLARQDPQGEYTTGIVRVDGGRPSWTQGNDALLKSMSYWPSEEYLNIWVCNLIDFIGYAQFPVSNLEGLEEFRDEIAATDGVVVTYDAFGSDDDDVNNDFNLQSPYNKGRTLTHELGHFFGLRHIWGDDTISNGCSGTDYIDDTPNQNQETSGCPNHPRTSCSEVIMFQNFMDYTNDACMNLFTQNQAERMDLILSDPEVPRRSSLLASKGLLYPGTLRNDVKLAQIKSPLPVSCGNDLNLVLSIQNLGSKKLASVQITYRIDEENPITSVESFDSVASITTITLPITTSEGEHLLSVTVDLPNGNPDDDTSNGSLTKKIVINSPTETLPTRQRFENTLDERWTIVSPYTKSQWVGNDTYYQQSLLFATTAGEKGESWLVSPRIDFTTTTEPSLRFDWSSYWNGSPATFLEVKYTNDCGASYQPLKKFTLQETTLSIRPSKEDDWNTTVVDLAPLSGQADVRVAFIVTSSNNNNRVHLDNIEFYVGKASPKIPLNEAVAVSCPEPGSISVTFNVGEPQSVGISIFDLLGRPALDGTEEKILNQTFAYTVNGLQTGIYIVRIKADGQYYSQKVFIPGR
jgi:hypothetical protein